LHDILIDESSLVDFIKVHTRINYSTEKNVLIYTGRGGGERSNVKKPTKKENGIMSTRNDSIRIRLPRREMRDKYKQGVGCILLYCTSEGGRRE